MERRVVEETLECYMCGKELHDDNNKDYGLVWFDYDKGAYVYLCHFDCIQKVRDTVKRYRDERLKGEEE